MKLQSTAFLLISLTLVRDVQASDECLTSVLLGLASNSHVAKCSSVAGFSSLSSINELTSEKIKAICASSACTKLMEDMAAMGLGDCRIPDTEIRIQSDILGPFTERCTEGGSTASINGSGNSNNIRDGSSSSERSDATSVVIGSLAVVTIIVSTTVL